MKTTFNIAIVNLMDGTVLSIVEWPHTQKLDLEKEQQLAFQTVTAASVVACHQKGVKV